MDEGTSNQPTTTESPQPVEKKEIVIKRSVLIVVAVIVIAVIAIAAFFYFSRPSTAEYIANYSAVLGSASATINVIEFSDYECPFCQAAEGVNEEIMNSLKQSDSSWQAPIPNIINDYVNTGKVKLIFRNFPVHPTSAQVALAASCAQEQSKYWEYHQMLFENYNALSDTDLKGYAANLGLDLNQFNQCLESKKYQSEIDKDLADGRALGVSGTPTFFIGNNETGYEKIVGAESYSAFKHIIDSKISV